MDLRRTTLCLAGALMAGGTGAQQAEQAPPAPTQVVAPPAPGETDPNLAPVIACDEPIFQFGDVENSETVEHDFVIRNDGKTTLEIIKAKPGCGCTVANISNKLIEPGGTSAIKAKLNLKGRDGIHNKSITVESNDPKRKTLTLTMRGTAIALVSVSPRTIMVPRLIAGIAATNRVRIVSREEGVLAVGVTTTGNPKVNGAVEQLEGTNAFEVVLTTSDDLPQGTTFGRVTINTNTKSRPVINVPFRYNVVGEISVYPLELSMVTQNQAITRTLTVGPGTVTEFAIEEVIVPDDKMKATVQELQNSRYRIVVSNIIPRMELNGKSVKIITTAKNMEEVDVSFKVITRN